MCHSSSLRPTTATDVAIAICNFSYCMLDEQLLATSIIIANIIVTYICIANFILFWHSALQIYMQA